VREPRGLIRGIYEVEFHLRMLSLAPLPAGVRGAVDRRGIPQSFSSMDQTWLDIRLFFGAGLLGCMEQ
jgi:hypothetical protein